MDKPFVFGIVATGDYFTDRTHDLKALKENFLFGTNTILISPRRWGKSSLVRKAADEIKAKDKNIRIVQIDMNNVRSQEDFYKLLLEQLLLSIWTRFEELASNTRKFLKQWIPKITYSPDAQQEFSFGLNWSEIKESPDEILDLAEKIAVERNIRIVICIDEFQNISYFSDPLAFQKKLRSHWQLHQHVSYCLYGSKRHMLTDVFASPGMPFYKFGHLMFLDKISTSYWQKYIQKRFTATAKKISKKQAAQIAEMVHNHPYYVQQLAQLTWQRSKNEADEECIIESFDQLILQLSLLFQNITESLNTTQVNFLKALLAGEKKLSSKKVLDNYKLGTSANINRIKKALINKEIIDDQGGKIELLDPVYEAWLRKYYF